MLVLLTAACGRAEWYKGAIHAHSTWSDGGAAPEDAAAWYKTNGYHFLSLTDHNVIQLNTNFWKRGRHLKTLNELKAQFEEPGRFLLIPGYEATRKYLHLNVINTTDVLPYSTNASFADAMRGLAQSAAQYATQSNRDVLVVLNHPDFYYYHVPPELLFDVPEVTFFEICNAHGGPASNAVHPLWHTPDKYWDIINAFRLEAGHPLVYGTGGDDTHVYTNSPWASNPGRAWVTVQADALEAATLIRAMKAGRFYVSTGVELEDITFDGQTFTVRVKPRKGVKHTIDFITTSRGFDRTTTPFSDPKRYRLPEQHGKLYSKDIGRVALRVKGDCASYTLKPGELYIRAKITSTHPSPNPGNNQPIYDTAWTQPFCPHTGKK